MFVPSTGSRLLASGGASLFSQISSCTNRMMALGVERSSPSRDSRSTKRCVRDTPSDATAVVARAGIINLDGVVACFGMIDILSQSGYGCSQLAPGTLRVGYVQLDPTEDAIEDKCRNCTFFVPLVVLNRSRSLTWIFQIKFSLAYTTSFSVLPPSPFFSHADAGALAMYRSAETLCKIPTQTRI